MSTSTPESREFLRQFKCVVETGTGVLTAFAQRKLLATYHGTFKQFLDDKKHVLFHLWQSKKLVCCECPPAGYNFNGMRHMDNWIFKKIYADNGPENRSHIICNGRDVVQVCLHKYITRNIAIDKFDISAISFLLRNLIKLSANETTTLDIITKTRSKICHAYSINCHSIPLLNTTWTALEKALVDLADPLYKGIIRQQIKLLRKVDLEKEEITKLLSNVEEVLQEVKASSNNNNSRLIGMETRLENNAISNRDDIKQHTTEEISYYTSQTQQALSENIQNTEGKLQKEMKEVKSYCQTLGTEVHETRSDVNDIKKKQEEEHAERMEMSKTIKNLELIVRCERPTNLFVPEEACADTMECSAIWHIAAPEFWDLKAIEATMKDQPNKDESFKVKVVKKGSLIMLTTVAASILSDSEAFEAAVMSFLTKMIKDCDINTEIPGRVDVTLHILNANEVSFSCEIPPEVRHKQGTENLTCIFPNTTTDDKAVQTEENVTCKVPNTTTDNKAVQTEGPMETEQYHHFPYVEQKVDRLKLSKKIKRHDSAYSEDISDISKTIAGPMETEQYLYYPYAKHSDDGIPIDKRIEYPDKTEGTEGSTNPWSKDPYSKDRDISKTYAERYLMAKERKEPHTKQFAENQFHLMQKTRKEPHTKPFGENQYPDKKESTGKSKNPWLKDPYLKNKDLPETHDFLSPPDLEYAEIFKG